MNKIMEGSNTDGTCISERSASGGYSEGNILHFLSRVGNALTVGVLFLVCSIPAVTVGTSAIAAYYAMMKAVRCERSYPVKEFFRAFKKNLVKGILYTVVLLAVAAVLVFDILYAGAIGAGSGQAIPVKAAYFVFAGLTAVFALWIFPVLSRFDISVGRTVILTFTIAVKYFYFTLALAAVAAVSVLLVLKLSVGFILVIPPAAIYGATYIVEPAFKHYIPKPEAGEDDWYYTGK